MLPRLSSYAAMMALTSVVGASASFAVSDQVRQFCREDYYAHCPNHALGSTNLRRCMKTAGPKLSSGCIKALVQAGEITQTEVREISRKLKSTP
ncbi:MAG: hypothetical protein Q7T86_06210 [Hyphomicrobiaceae bacterium]|jgi:hypothetical protein|nr:hypothetical protein [Hyphomicrobiaceae bacterium]